MRARGNITESQQFTSLDTGNFFMRLQIESPAPRTEVEAALAPVMSEFGIRHRLDQVGRPLRTLVLASRAGHCLNDLLFRRRSGQLAIEVPLVLSNHADLADLARFYDVPFESQPITDAASKQRFENRLVEVIAEYDIELVVLARYMQVLSADFCERMAGRIINIHHSFLPGFKGANPYQQAHERGVKLIGATAHFVTEQLDEGPIIEQNVVRVDHTKSVADLVAMGQDEESRTLSQAVRWFSEDRILLDGQRTIIFR